MSTDSSSNAADSGRLSLPPIVFGTSTLGNLYQSVAMQTKCEIVSQWFEQTEGLVAIDTAGKYGAGLALESIALGLAQCNADPDRILIGNKLGWRRVPLTTPEPTFEPGAWVDLEYDAVQDISYDGMMRCWEQGSELLSPYRSQLGSVHDPDEYLAAATDDADRKSRWQDLTGAYQALVDLRDRGDVRAIGVGSKDWRASRQLSEQCELDWIMLATSLTVHTHDAELLTFVESMRERGVLVINSSVFNSGFLTGGDFYDYRKVSGESQADQSLLEWRSRFHALCKQFDVAPAAACVAFGKSPPGITSVALSSSRPERVRQNVALIHAEPPAPFWSALKDAALIDRNYPYL